MVAVKVFLVLAVVVPIALGGEYQLFDDSDPTIGDVLVQYCTDATNHQDEHFGYFCRGSDGVVMRDKKKLVRKMTQAMKRETEFSLSQGEIDKLVEVATATNKPPKLAQRPMHKPKLKQDVRPKLGQTKATINRGEAMSAVARVEKQKIEEQRKQVLADKARKEAIATPENCLKLMKLRNEGNEFTMSIPVSRNVPSEWILLVYDASNQMLYLDDRPTEKLTITPTTKAEVTGTGLTVTGGHMSGNAIDEIRLGAISPLLDSPEPLVKFINSVESEDNTVPPEFSAFVHSFVEQSLYCKVIEAALKNPGNEDTATRLKNKRIMFAIGPSASGKTTVTRIYIRMFEGELPDEWKSGGSEHFAYIAVDGGVVRDVSVTWNRYKNIDTPNNGLRPIEYLTPTILKRDFYQKMKGSIDAFKESLREQLRKGGYNILLVDTTTGGYGYVNSESEKFVKGSFVKGYKIAAMAIYRLKSVTEVAGARRGISEGKKYNPDSWEIAMRAVTHVNAAERILTPMMLVDNTDFAENMHHYVYAHNSLSFSTGQLESDTENYQALVKWRADMKHVTEEGAPRLNSAS